MGIAALHSTHISCVECENELKQQLAQTGGLGVQSTQTLVMVWEIVIVHVGVSHAAAIAHCRRRSIAVGPTPQACLSLSNGNNEQNVRAYLSLSHQASTTVEAYRCVLTRCVSVWIFRVQL
jgi:copper chaperone CopZ